SMGTLMVAISDFSPAATTAALYYLVHSTFVAAALFLLADLVIARREVDDLGARPATLQNGLFASLFFAAAVGMAGMPPLSGFIGKLMVLDALRAPGTIAWAWSAVLIGSLVTIVGFARAGSTLFWKSTAILPAASGEPDAQAEPTGTGRPAGVAELAPVMTAIALLALLTAFAGPLVGYLDGTTAQIFDRDGYVTSVLGTEGET
ncbi:proton-conducting transporter membrane subunit, partial [Hoeflea sp.]|uniref:proton-conducting transporter transmembrane domain-containing protein n=1 Tax=Hoeflea sp. TaxID=1940281 RepID=UPI0019CDBB6B